MRPSANLVDELIEKFIVPGEIDSLDAPHNNFMRQCINSLALPLQIVKIDKRMQKARLSVDPEKSQACKAVMEELSKSGDQEEEQN